MNGYGTTNDSSGERTEFRSIRTGQRSVLGIYFNSHGSPRCVEDDAGRSETTEEPKDFSFFCGASAPSFCCPPTWVVLLDMVPAGAIRDDFEKGRWSCYEGVGVHCPQIRPSGFPRARLADLCNTVHLQPGAWTWALTTKESAANILRPYWPRSSHCLADRITFPHFPVPERRRQKETMAPKTRIPGILLNPLNPAFAVPVSLL
ncbi:hypothetical protein ACFL6C_07775 [Myxococcota bacterium]